MASRRNLKHQKGRMNQSELFLSGFLRKARLLLTFQESRQRQFENEDSAIGYEASWSGVFMNLKDLS